MKAPQQNGYDVVVVGAGVIGLSCGWRLAEAGLSVAVLDREGPGAGASGVAAGMLAPVTEASWGEEELLRLNLRSADMWPTFARELAERSGADAGYERRGALVVAVDRDDAAELRRLHDFQRSLELDVDWLTRSELRALEPGLAPGIAGGIQAPQDHQADPRALVAALEEAARRAGARLLAPTEVIRVEIGDGRVRGVATANGTVVASRVVLAAGAWSGRLEGIDPTERPPIRPVKGQILRLRGSEAPLSRHALHTPRCYVVPRASGEVVVGATVEERGYDTTVTADGVFRLLEATREVLPDVGELELVECAARLRPGTPDNLPAVGGGATEGLVWATGHYRNGILLAPVTAGAVLAAVMRGEVEPLGSAAAPARFATAAVGGSEAPALAGRPA
jgi:glycine oxidase